jgi:hypothetical protein
MPQITVRTKNEQLYYSVAIATGISCIVLVSSRGVGKTVLPIVLTICKKKCLELTTIVSSKLIFLLLFKTLKEDDGWLFNILEQG